MKLDIVVAKDDIYYGGKTIFKRNRSYFGRWSLSGRQYMVKTEQDTWHPLIFSDYYLTYKRAFDKNFRTHGQLYAKNKKEINQLTTVHEFMEAHRKEREKWTVS